VPRRRFGRDLLSVDFGQAGFEIRDVAIPSKIPRLPARRALCRGQAGRARRASLAPQEAGHLNRFFQSFLIYY
jgi:hypothetical protein